MHKQINHTQYTTCNLYFDLFVLPIIIAAKVGDKSYIFTRECVLLCMHSIHVARYPHTFVFEQTHALGDARW